MALTKKEARAAAKARRRMLDQTALGRAFADVLFDLPVWQAADTVLAFASLPDEPDTMPVLRRALADGKRLLLPRVIGEGRMEWVGVRTLATLCPAAFGILEPVGLALPDCCGTPGTLALVPCLAADRSGVRLGRGGGYYDRFLAHYNGNRLLICPEALLFDALPREDYDIVFRPDELLTEKGILNP